MRILTLHSNHWGALMADKENVVLKVDDVYIKIKPVIVHGGRENG